MDNLTKDQAREKVKDITESLANYFDKEEVEVGVVMSVLLTMCVHTMLEQGGVSPHEAIRIFADAICFHEKESEDDDDNEGEMQWLN
jgi:hypothetical protein